MKLDLRVLALLSLALPVWSAGACRSAPSEEEPRAYGDVRQESERTISSGAARQPGPPVPHGPPGAIGASTTATAPGAPPSTTPTGAPRAENRDPKGQRDVQKYIDVLESEGRRKELKVDLVIEKLELPRDAVIGDLGCGPGVFALAFAKACPEGVVFATDVEPAQIDRVREKVEQAGLRNVVPVLAGFGDPHLPLARLDYVFIGDTYHHLEDRVTYLRRLKDVLKPGGKLVLLEYKPGELPVGPPADHKLPAGVMDKELQKAGYVLIDRFNTHAYHDFEVWRLRHPWERE